MKKIIECKDIDTLRQIMRACGATYVGPRNGARSGWFTATGKATGIWYDGATRLWFTVL